ncbi:MAG: hypothetical protein NTU61_01780 [Candidatus Altiarchaeota archaeon]|nr:hypothetical protein [Candidatus Altiarchaeota archaeon]
MSLTKKPVKHRVFTTAAEKRKLREQRIERGDDYTVSKRKNKVDEIAESYEFSGGYAEHNKRRGIVYHLSKLIGVAPKAVRKPKKKSKFGSSLNPYDAGGGGGSGGLRKLK